MIEIFQEPGERASLQLDPILGEEIRSFIMQDTNMSFARYLEKVGMHQTNVANYLCGRNRITLAVLSKLLAGTNLQLQCVLQVSIKPGQVAENVDSMPLEEMLFEEEAAQSVTDTLNTTPTTPSPQYSS